MRASPLRLDRFFTLRLVAPFCRQGTGRILPILMYHSVSDDPEAGVNPYFKVCVSPRQFDEQMDWIAARGHRGVSLREGLAWLQAAASSAQPSPLPSKNSAPPVAITFDDGFQDFHTAAFPSLQRHGFTATMYLPTGLITEPRQAFLQRPCLTWSEVRTLQAAGMEFGSHTVTHPRLVQCQWPQIERELRDSKTEIEQQLGTACPAFAYPFGFPQMEKDFVARLGNILRSAGYESCVTTIVGRASLASDPFLLPRLPANSADDRPLFAAKLAGAYDWIGPAQAISKQAAKFLRPGSRPVATATSAKTS